MSRCWFGLQPHDVLLPVGATRWRTSTAANTLTLNVFLNHVERDETNTRRWINSAIWQLSETPQNKTTCVFFQLSLSSDLPKNTFAGLVYIIIALRYCKPVWCINAPVSRALAVMGDLIPRDTEWPHRVLTATAGFGQLIPPYQQNLSFFLFFLLSINSPSRLTLLSSSIYNPLVPFLFCHALCKRANTPQ